MVQAATTPGQTVGISVFVDHLMADLDLSRSAVSTSYLIGTLIGASTLPAAGRYIDRSGPSRAVGVLGAAFGVCLIAMSAVTGIVTLTIGFIAIRAIGQGALTLAAGTAVAVGFDTRRGAATGIKSATAGALMSLVPIGSAVMIGVIGWRTSWIFLGLTASAILIPLAASGTLVRSGQPPPARIPRRSGPRTGVAALSTMPFWVVTASVSLSAFVGTGLMFHHIDLMAARGLDATAAAANFLPQTIAGAAAAIAVGHLADRWPASILLAAANTALGLSALAVIVIGPGLAAIAYGAILGAATTSIRAIEGTVLPRWYGTTEIGRLRGIVMAASVAASAAGPLSLALTVDHLGSYRPALFGCAAASLVLAIAATSVAEIDHVSATVGPARPSERAAPQSTSTSK